MPAPNQAIAAAVNAAVGAIEDTAAKNTNNIPSKSVDDAKPELKAAITKAIAADPQVQFSTNTEPWYTKRSRWSAIVGVGVVVLAPVLTYFGFNLDPATKELVVTSLTTIGGLAASWLAYRAGTATTPLGTKPAPYPLNRG